MNISNHYGLRQFIPWTKTKLYKVLIFSIVPTLLFYLFDWKWLAIPWVPVAMLGTAAAFISGFRNTQTYNRTWEARQIYGSIITGSQAFGIMMRDFIRTEDKTKEKQIHQQLIYRHFAWLTSLRYQLRETKSWENVKTRSYNREYLKHYQVPEWEGSLEEELKSLLNNQEQQALLSANNKATQIIALQSAQLRRLNEEGSLPNHIYSAVENQLKEFYDLQSKCERIKNFPYPRQFSSINLFFTNILCLLLPLGFIGEFSTLTTQAGPHIIWLAIPFSVLIGWVFLVLEQIGESTENPFEGSPNDIPITQISRSIEIDLRQMLGEKELPETISPKNQILM